MVLQSLSWLGEMAWVELEPGGAQREHRADTPEPPEAVLAAVVEGAKLGSGGLYLV